MKMKAVFNINMETDFNFIRKENRQAL